MDSYTSFENGMQLNEYQRLRLDKVKKFRDLGIDPYPPRFLQRTHSVAEVLQNFEALQKDDHADPPVQGVLVGVSGRLMLKRDKKVVFGDLIEDGNRIQIYLKDAHLEAGEQSLLLFKDSVDLGDIIGVVGKPFITKTGDKTIEVHQWNILSKAINQPPDKHAGLQDTEQRYRQRYVDLISNPEVRDVFVKRSRIISAMRSYLDRQGFLEVETPTLQPLYGGASARPFVTHHNALDQNFYMRIADELYLKRLVSGGFGKVYEICKDFRNEGIDVRHNPEFTMMECYAAYWDYNDVMKLVEEMFAYIAQEVLGTLKVQTRGYEVDFTPPYRRLQLRQAIIDYTGLDYEQYPEQEDLYREVKKLGVDVAPDTVWPKLVDETLKTFVIPKLIQPTFLYDYPEKLSPLAKKKPGVAGTVERFQPFIAGLECGNAFTELNDPVDQRERFLDQKRNQDAGDDEAMQMDLDFINALMYGMPPTGGLGVGIDRLCMLLLDQASIRDVILFPQMRNL
ncbi:lysine--tRNA ligase [Candidatus Chlorohelix sp.]|uniref:lysine--tRNA ligase n=1 Tax=Candidatus Chlorohelix sp. TaxID=3139201 RepID=UPI0031454B95